MREKSRERGKGVKRGFESGVGVSGFRSKVKDRLLRSIEIRGREIAISSTNLFADAIFRISVSFSDSTHYIFLDEILLRWLKEVLQKSMEAGWRMSRGILKRSGTRVMQVGSFILKGEHFLRIMEICRNGRRFFVSIPMDDLKWGWGSWLKSIQSVLEGRLNRLPLEASFAEVLGRGVGGGGSLAQPSMEVTPNSMPAVPASSLLVVPAESGFELRLTRLRRWLVVNFVLGPKDFVAWGDFRRWMLRWWGVELEREVKMLGDDSWLVECDSESVVSKIIEKGSWFFKGVSVEVRRWFPDAGRLNLLERQGLRWVLVFGILVHLRENEVFRKIGEICGGYVDSQDTVFSAVRLKVRRVKEPPSSLTLMAGGENFEIKIIEEPCFSERGDNMPKRREEGSSSGTAASYSRPEKKEKVGAAVAARFRVEEGTPVFGPAFKPNSAEKKSEILSGAALKHLEWNGLHLNGGPEGGLAQEMDQHLEGNGLILNDGPRNGLAQELDLIRDMEFRLLGRAEEGFGRASVHLGLELELDPSDLAQTIGRGSFSQQFEFEANREEALGSECRGGTEFVPPPRLLGSDSEKARKELREAEDSSDDNSVYSDFLDSSVEVRSLALGIAAGEEVEGDPDHINLDNDWESVAAMGQSLANLFDLRMDGSKEAAMEEVQRVTKEVLQRRAHAGVKSKQELELRRLDWSLAEANPTESARRSRYVSPELQFDES
ncbi:hypothetical protein LINPERPRIM_LOCUS15335 [Linum perenne]